MTGIILAGGKSSRFGDNKAFMPIEGRPLIEKTVEVLAQVFDEIIIVSNRPADYNYLGVKVVEDIIPGKGPLSGIHAGVASSTSLYNFVVACDMPFLNSALIRSMQGEIAGYDALVPRIYGRVEPLHAFYSRNCLEQFEACLQAQNFSVTDFLKKRQVKYLDIEEILPFVNINTGEDWKGLSTVLSVEVKHAQNFDS